MDCTVSIVIPFYCTPEALFTRCMDSILSAGLTCLEVIVVDDGSPAEYQPMLAAWGERDSVRVLHIPNSGVSEARNRGVREAKGGWIMFVDSDDHVDTEALRKAAAFVRDCRSDVVIFSGGRDSNGSIHFNTTFLKPGINYAADEKSRIALMESALAVGLLPQGYVQYYTLGAPYSKMLRAEFLRQHQLAFDTEVKLAEDALFALHLYQAAEDIVFVDLNLYYYVVNPQSVTRRYRPGFSADMDVFFAHVRDFMIRYHLEEELKRAYYIRAQFEINRCMKLEYFHPDNKDPNAVAAFRQVIRREPYRTALRDEYLLDRRFVRRVRLWLLRRGMPGLLLAAGRFHAFLVHRGRKPGRDAG